MSKEEAETRGYRPFSGFYSPSTYWMLPAIEADMIRVKREYVCVEGNIKGLEIFAQ